MPESGPGLALWAPDGIGEVSEGTDLTALVLAGLGPDGLRDGLQDGDVVVLTSKVVSKAEGRSRPGNRDEALVGETVRLVARRGPTSIVVNPLGLVMAAAGIDASNVTPGTVLLLPEDPDATSRRIREGLLERTGRNVAVVISDTAGRAWRFGQTDLAIGAAGIEPLDDHNGRIDGYGNPLAVTAPAAVDEIAAAAELVTGKLGGRPLTRFRGLAERVLPPGEHGPGASALVRPVSQDMFALGSREAVLAALGGEQPASFGTPASLDDTVRALEQVGLTARPAGPAADGGVVVEPPDAQARWRLGVAAYALGWAVTTGQDSSPEDRPDDRTVLHPRTP